MIRQKLDDVAVAAKLAELQGWTLVPDGKAIEKHFVFNDFRQAFGFMTQAALAAEKIDHHPEWSNVYRKVHVVLTTHSANGLTELDFQLAVLMDMAGRDAA
jgi:4a-hydroxytetrahydrobiopterin dehydratase